MSLYPWFAVSTLVIWALQELDYIPNGSYRQGMLYIFVLAIILNQVASSIWHAFFSPLRRIPAVRSPLGFLSLLAETPRGSRALQWIEQMAPDADFVRVNTPFHGQELIPVSPRALADVMNHKAYDFQRFYGARAFLAYALGWGLITSEGQEHKYQRKAVGPTFAAPKIAKLYPLMWHKSQMFVEALKPVLKQNPATTSSGSVLSATTSSGSVLSGYVQISNWMSRLTLDIIGPTAMGRDFNTLDGNPNPIQEKFHTMTSENATSLFLALISHIFPSWWPYHATYNLFPLYRGVSKTVNQICLGIVSDTRQKIVEQKQVDPNDHDLLSDLMRSTNLDDQRLVAQMLTFLGAGHETTANALSWLCYVLCKDQDLQSRLRHEIRSTIPSLHSDVDGALLESLPLLNGVCNEILRLYPTVPMLTRTAINDTVLAEQAVPKGTQIILIPYALNRLPRYWGPDAAQFRPERWIDTSTNEKGETVQRANNHGGVTSNYGFMTFLHGPRSCIGQGFAKAELRCAVAALVGSYQFELKDPSKEVTPGGIVTMKPVGGLDLKMTVVEGW